MWGTTYRRNSHRLVYKQTPQYTGFYHASFSLYLTTAQGTSVIWCIALGLVGGLQGPPLLAMDQAQVIILQIRHPSGVANMIVYPEGALSPSGLPSLISFVFFPVNIIFCE